MTAALDELQRRLKGGVRGIVGSEARISTGRTQRQLTEKARDNPTLLGVAGVVFAGAVGYGIVAGVRALQERNSPRGRLKRVRNELTERVEEGVGQSRRQLERQIERVLPRGLLVKVEPESKGYMRVTEARLDTAKDKGRSEVIKKLLWAAVLSVFMAVASVVARRVAGSVWRVTVREAPPTERKRED